MFRSTMSATTAPKARQLKTENTCIVKKYLDNLDTHIRSHDLINKPKTISNQLIDGNNLTDAITTQLDNIDNLCIQGCCKQRRNATNYTPGHTDGHHQSLISSRQLHTGNTWRKERKANHTMLKYFFGYKKPFWMSQTQYT